MRIIRLCFVVTIVAHVLCVGSSTAYSQLLPRDPSTPLAPTEYRQCSAFSEEWDRLESEIDRLHEKCLENNQKNNSQRNAESGSGPGSRCSFSSCQSLHTRKYDIKSKKGPAVESCEATVEKYQDGERRRREAEEKRRQEAEEREARARAEQEQKEAARRERAEAEDKKRDDEREARRKREENDRKLIQMAAEQKQRELEALARRTEERQRQKEELEQRKPEVNARYEQDIEKQTGDAQDALLAQLGRNAGTQNTVFPDPARNSGEEFDLSSMSNNSDKTGANALAGGLLPELSSQREEAIAPERDSYFARAFGRVRDFVSPIVNKGREVFTEALRDQVQENLGEIKDSIVAGAFGDEEGFQDAESMARKYFDNSYKDPIHQMVNSAFDQTAGALVKEATDDISKSVSSSLHPRFRSDGLTGALTDVAIKHGAEKLTAYARDTFVDGMSAKVQDAYRDVSTRLLGPTDPVTQPVQDTAILRLPSLISKTGSPAAAAKAVYDYGVNMVNAMGEMFDRLVKSEFFGTAPPDNDKDE